MKERPILFSAPMVRAILAGTKTQTRRRFKLPRGCSWYEALGGEAEGQIQDDDGPGWWCVDEQSCPHGQPGDRLFVREAHAFTDLPDGTPVVAYASDKSQIAIGRSAPDSDDHLIHDFKFRDEVHVERWKPSIHMPRWASRITLEVTRVRVERLQDISEADCVAEGCTKNHNNYYCGGPHKAGGLKQMATAKQAYQDLWELINDPGSWEANPWVWVVEFKRVEGN